MKIICCKYVKDHARAAVLLNSSGDAPGTTEKLSKQFPGLKGEVCIDQPLNNSGYRGIHLAVAMSNGQNAEIQISTPEAWKIKKETDAIYDKWRNVDVERMTAQQNAEYEKDNAYSYALWESYYSGILPEVKRMASASVTGLASKNTPRTPLNGSHLPSANESFGKAPMDAITRPPSVNENLYLDLDAGSNTGSPPNHIIANNKQNGNTEPQKIQAGGDEFRAPL